EPPRLGRRLRRAHRERDAERRRPPQRDLDRAAQARARGEPSGDVAAVAGARRPAEARVDDELIRAGGEKRCGRHARSPSGAVADRARARAPRLYRGLTSGGARADRERVGRGRAGEAGVCCASAARHRQTRTPLPDPTVPSARLLAYGVPAVGLSYLLFLVQFYLLHFATAVLLLEAGVVGLLFAIAKRGNAVLDPIVGSWSDRTRGRFGRRRPYLLGALPLLALG